MSFQPVNIVLFSMPPLPVQPKTLPQWWGYLSTTDNIAAVSAAGYFNASPDSYLQRTSLLLGDQIYCVCSDGVVQLEVTAVSPNVTTTAAPLNPGSVNTAAIQNGAVTTAKIADANVTTAKIADANVTTAKIADANVTTAKIADANVTTAKIADANVTTAKIADANVTLAKLAAGITPSHVIKFAGQPTTVGGAAAEAFNIPGAVAATDDAFVQMVNQGTNVVSIVRAVVTADTLTVIFSADPGNDCVFSYQLIRAAA